MDVSEAHPLRRLRGNLPLEKQIGVNMNFSNSETK